MRRAVRAKVIFNQRLAKDIFLLKVEPEEKLTPAFGQFFMLKITSGKELLLARPFSWFRIDKSCIEFLYQVVGKGTFLLSKFCAGEELTLLGPLGRGFWLRDDARKVLLVAGGVGISGIYAWAEELAKRVSEIFLVWGVRSKEQFFPLRLSDRINLYQATELSSTYFKGLATELAEKVISEKEPDYLYACGPRAMLKSLALLAKKHNLSGQVLYEERMGCGLGACLACAVPARSGGYLHTCSDGPVFEFDEIDWERVK